LLCFFAEEAKRVYSWQQEDNSITISFDLPEGTLKSNIEFQLSPNGRLNVGLKNPETTLLSGDLYGKVDIEASSWFISDNKV